MSDSETGDLPELRSATLTRAEVQTLVSDILACSVVKSVRLKSAGKNVAETASTPLHDAHTKFLRGEADGLQIRYIYEGREYFDTLLKTEGGYKLVRM